LGDVFSKKYPPDSPFGIILEVKRHTMATASSDRLAIPNTEIHVDLPTLFAALD